MSQSAGRHRAVRKGKRSCKSEPERMVRANTVNCGCSAWLGHASGDAVGARGNVRISCEIAHLVCPMNCADYALRRTLNYAICTWMFTGFVVCIVRYQHRKFSAVTDVSVLAWSGIMEEFGYPF
jgi:hypothetical protein